MQYYKSLKNHYMINKKRIKIYVDKNEYFTQKELNKLCLYDYDIKNHFDIVNINKNYMFFVFGYRRLKNEY